MNSDKTACVYNLGHIGNSAFYQCENHESCWQLLPGQAAHKQWHCVMLITADTMPSDEIGFIYC